MKKFEVPFKYDITDEINNILLKGQAFKRKGRYKEAEKIYDYILKIDGPSGILYIAMAKNLACQMNYEDAIELLKLANSSCIEEMGIEDFNCLYHIEQLENRNKMGKETFLRYMKAISGNPFYKFPR